MGAWESNDIPGLKFKDLRRTTEEVKYHSVLVIQEDVLNSALAAQLQSEDKIGQIYHLDLMFSGLISAWAVLALLEGYTYHVNKIRDSRIFKTGVSQDTVRILNEWDAIFPQR